MFESRGRGIPPAGIAEPPVVPRDVVELAPARWTRVIRRPGEERPARHGPRGDRCGSAGSRLRLSPGFDDGGDPRKRGRAWRDLDLDDEGLRHSLFEQDGAWRRGRTGRLHRDFDSLLVSWGFDRDGLEGSRQTPRRRWLPFRGTSLGLEFFQVAEEPDAELLPRPEGCQAAGLAEVHEFGLARPKDLGAAKPHLRRWANRLGSSPGTRGGLLRARWSWLGLRNRLRRRRFGGRHRRRHVLRRWEERWRGDNSRRLRRSFWLASGRYDGSLRGSHVRRDGLGVRAAPVAVEPIMLEDVAQNSCALGAPFLSLGSVTRRGVLCTCTAIVPLVFPEENHLGTAGGTRQARHASLRWLGAWNKASLTVPRSETGAAPLDPRLRNSYSRGSDGRGAPP